jgi:hypothetical protein
MTRTNTEIQVVTRIGIAGGTDVILVHDSGHEWWVHSYSRSKDAETHAEKIRLALSIRTYSP